MATTIVPADLIVTISESYSLNGVDYGNTMNKTYLSNGQVSQRVMSIAGKASEGATWTDILALTTVDGQGQVVKTDYKYFRITNLDTVNTLNLRVYNGSDYIALEVSPASSFLFMDAGVDSPVGTGAITFADIQAIAGQSSHNTEAIDVEFMMVTA
tara:strand:- start:344 stop:811 length:468 start_codon:yes stop_codon:yes gene_type:complete